MDAYPAGAYDVERAVQHVVAMLNSGRCEAFGAVREYVHSVGVPLGKGTDPRIRTAVLDAFVLSEIPTLKQEYVDKTLSLFGLTLEEFKRHPGMQEVIAHAIARALSLHLLEKAELLTKRYFNANTCNPTSCGEVIRAALHDEHVYRAAENDATLSAWFVSLCELFPEAVRPPGYRSNS